MNNVICNNIRNTLRGASLEAAPEVSCIDKIPAAGIYVTEQLLNEMRAVSSDLVFCDGVVFGSGIEILSEVLNFWETGFREFREFLISENSRISKPIVLGTSKEVLEYGKKFKVTGEDEGRLRDVQLKLINSASSNDIRENLDNILELTAELKSLCDQLNDSRCTFYVPAECTEVFSAHPVYLNPESERGCRISGGISRLQPGCILMSYELEEGSELSFTARFYQALYYELFQSLIMDRYRDNKEVNEGLAELYSRGLKR